MSLLPEELPPPWQIIWESDARRGVISKDSQPHCTACGSRIKPFRLAVWVNNKAAVDLRFDTLEAAVAHAHAHEGLP